MEEIDLSSPLEDEDFLELVDEQHYIRIGGLRHGYHLERAIDVFRWKKKCAFTR